MSVIHDGSNTASETEAHDIDVFNEYLQDNNYWVIAVGVQGPETAMTFDNRNDADIEEHKPFIESKEFLNGFWIIDVADENVAQQMSRMASKACNRKIELRPLYR